jgi:hypothetical protein
LKAAVTLAYSVNSYTSFGVEHQRTKTLVLEIILGNINLKTADGIHLPDCDVTMAPPLSKIGECFVFSLRVYLINFAY